MSVKLENIVTRDAFKDALVSDLGKLTVIHFWAPWSEPSKHMNEVMMELAKEHSKVKFFKVEAEALPDITVKYEVLAVPAFLLFKDGQVIDRVNGANAPELTKKVTQHAHTSFSQPVVVSETEDLNVRLKKLVDASKCIVFMKGTPVEPRCGFSRRIVELLNKCDADFSSFNVLADQEVREGIKEFSEWPTFPQLFIDGALVGGLDIAVEMAESGELQAMLPKKISLEDRLKQLIDCFKVMVFMKGSKQEPRCGFSKAVCALLDETGVEYKTFNILEDNDVREGLKKFSNWPTYPQVYVDGELVGGFDIIKELKENGELLSTLHTQ